MSTVAVETPIPPPPARWVTDTVGFLPATAVAALDAQLAAYARSSGNQVLVWIGDTTGDTPTEDWTVRAFERWRVGQRGLDNGLVLFLFAADRTVRVEVGYGLEERVPDVVAARVIRDTIVPALATGDRSGAVVGGVRELVAAISGQPAREVGAPAQEQAGRGRPARPLTAGQVVVLLLLAAGFLLLLITNPSLALWLLFSILSGGRGGGFGGGGGGGFSGGGGRSVGGGATGSW